MNNIPNDRTLAYRIDLLKAEMSQVNEAVSGPATKFAVGCLYRTGVAAKGYNLIVRHLGKENRAIIGD